MMLEFPLSVLPRLGLEGARFGEHRAEHRGLFGEFESWPSESHSGLTDLYTASLVSFEYDADDRLVFIEINNDEGDVRLGGVRLLNRPLEEVLENMRGLGHELAGPYGGVYAYPELGMRIATGYDPEVCEGATTKFIGLLPEETRPQFQSKT
ncbi:hypothetical protein [Glycomyces paridis]|uniref:Uncharacterized protein n=1 Tax=Glycomyces paridis TaxID=2126555 RepID=A0A4S8PP70_9ACTN|nr:hypothetical protein [Glycomyces paridis]THV30124.1 hypothetical protein E9998_07030 [Glycomyces paridis]